MGSYEDDRIRNKNYIYLKIKKQRENKKETLLVREYNLNRIYGNSKREPMIKQITELDILDNVENTSSKKTKQLILKEALGVTNLSSLLDAAFNFKRKFYIKKFDITSETRKPEFREDKHDEFMALLHTLESESIRGDGAKNAIEEFLTSCTDQQQKWYSRVIRKDLKAGFSISTANKSGFNIPRFEVMLAKDGKICKKLDDVIAAGGYVSKKFDGYRCLAEVDNGDVTLYSRNGTVYDNFPSIEKALSNAFPTGKHIFDGEIMSDDFQSMQKTAFAGKKGITVGDVKYFIFGCIDYSEWNASKFKMKMTSRIKLLNDTVAKVILLNGKLPVQIEIVDHIWVNDMNKIQELERQYMAEGFEGAMFLPDVPYYLGKKSNKMLKFKTMESMEGWIVSLNQGEKGSKFEGTLGSFTVKQEDGQLCRCGSGLTDADRKHIWSTPDKWYNKCLEIKYQELTPDGIMRFPVFVRWRPEKDAS